MSPGEQWQLSGNAAELYERYVVPYILGPWAPGLVELAAMPVAGEVAALSDEARTALVSHVGATLQSYVDGDRLAFPSEANLAVAYT